MDATLLADGRQHELSFADELDRQGRPKYGSGKRLAATSHAGSIRLEPLRVPVRVFGRRSVLVPSFVPLSMYARLRADARARDGTISGMITHGDGFSEVRARQRPG